MSAAEDAETGQQRPGLIGVGEPARLSLHDTALHEAGKTLINESLSVGRDFCSSMIKVSTSAIPLYLGIFAFVQRDASGFGVAQTALILTPVVVFLAASVVFTLGYWPRTGILSLDVLDEIEAFRDQAFKRRTDAARAGLVLFVAATLTSALVLVVSLAT